MLSNILFFIIVASVSADGFDPKKGCDVSENFEKLMCQATDNLIKEDNGKLSKYLCGCISSFYTTDASTCHAENYEFKDTKICQRIFKDKSFKKLSSSYNYLSEFVVDNVLKKMFKWCHEKDENKLVKYLELIFVPGPVVNLIEAEMHEKYKGFIPCYREIQQLTLQSYNKEKKSKCLSCLAKHH